MLKRYLIFIILLATCHCCRADNIAINNFEVKDNPFGNNQIAVVAIDSLKNTQNNVNGQFAFTINGFEQELTFNKGVAFYSPKIDKSIFLYLRHVNDNGSHGNLYYVYKYDDKLSPIHISWLVLLGVPLFLILLAYMFKRFIIIAIIIFVIIFYFNHHSGLSISTFFESILDGLRNIF